MLTLEHTISWILIIRTNQQPENCLVGYFHQSVRPTVDRNYLRHKGEYGQKLLWKNNKQVKGPVSNRIYYITATMIHDVNISTDDQQGYIRINAFKTLRGSVQCWISCWKIEMELKGNSCVSTCILWLQRSFSKVWENDPWWLEDYKFITESLCNKLGMCITSLLDKMMLFLVHPITQGLYIFIHEVIES